MSDIIVLDTGVLGMLVHPAETGEPRECKVWLKQLVSRGAIFCIPEIADYELRRELIRMARTESIRRLGELKATLRYVPITTPTMLKAAEFWASARAAGRPTADEKALDANAILAAQSIEQAEPGSDVIVATTNVSHLTRFVQARLWRDISWPAPAETSQLALGHLLCDQQIDLALMVLVVRQTREHVGLGQRWKARRGDAVDGLAVLQQTDDVMNADARAFDARISTAHAWRMDNVAVGSRDRAHVRFPREFPTGARLAPGHGLGQVRAWRRTIRRRHFEWRKRARIP